MGVLLQSSLKVADEAFFVVADLHRLRPASDDFSISEILEHVSKLRLAGQVRPGVEIHVRQHCVANLPPNPGRYRMLFASGKARRRLLLPGDPVDPMRDGKIWPEPADVPVELRELIEWAKARYGGEPAVLSAPFRGLLGLRGTGKAVWSDEHADDYVKRLRGGWN